MDPMKPGSSNAPASGDPFRRNPDGTVPEDSIVPPDPTHVASVRGDAADQAEGEPPAKKKGKK